MNEIIQEMRLSRAFACAFFDALTEGKVDVPKEVLEKFDDLKRHYDTQISRELS